MSGARAMISSAVTIRSFADFPPVRSAKMSIAPAASISSETQPMPEIIGSSHSAKYTLGRRVKCAARWRAPASPAASSSARRSARSAAPTIAPSMRIMSKISATVRWLKASTSTPCRTSAATISACRSEKLRLNPVSARGSSGCPPRWKPCLGRGCPPRWKPCLGRQFQIKFRSKDVFGLLLLQCRHAAVVAASSLTGVEDRAVIDWINPKLAFERARLPLARN
jgi:hypothetical protein